ncbi:MAG: nuclear transport factor 2 family protein [Aestuariivirga sp.]
MTTATTREIANLQLEAYNAHDIEAYMALFADDAFTHDLRTGRDIVRGAAAIREFYVARFANPSLHCTVLNRMEAGEFAIDFEELHGLPGGPVRLIAIYEVRDGLIRSVRFVWE